MMANAEPRAAAESLWSGMERVSQVVAGEAHERSIQTPLQEPVEILRDAFGLSPFELDLLLLCADAALNPRSGVRDSDPAEALGSQSSGDPTFRLALGKLDAPHWSALSRARPLRFWNLVEMGPGPALDAALRVDERILHFLLAIPALDERLDGLFRPMPPACADDDLSSAHEALASRAVQIWRAPRERHPLHLLGGSAAERAELFQQICAAAGLLPWEARAADLPESALERDRLARAWTREAVLAPAALLVRLEGREELRRLEPWLKAVNAPVALESEEESLAAPLDALRLTLPGLDGETRRRLWHSRLGSLAAGLNGQLERMVEAFPLDSVQIGLAADALRRQLASTSTQEAPALAWTICRDVARQPLDQLASRVERQSTWDDLVLPEAQTAILRQIEVHAREASVVNRTWGFADRHALGLGLSALFAGSSGTGKTMAAGILARSLDRDLYQIDLSTVVSKYIGETEKHLRRIFDAAEQSGAILLFDEADALFGKRSEVKDSHDRYANLEISYLLQRMEAYRGIALLTTNMQHALDPAFLRRLRFLVQFPFPGPEDRACIWRGIFPPGAPLDDLHFDRLAQLNVSGGVIRNIAFHAAFLAAGDRSSIGMRHVLAAARTEYGKMERPLSAAEMRGWS